MSLNMVRDVPPSVVVAHDDPGTADSLRHAVESLVGWLVVVAEPGPAGLGAALASGPVAALVGCDLLGDLPPGCRVPVLAIGDDTRPADLRSALSAGARGLLAWPDGAADLPGELARVAALARPRPVDEVPTLLIAVRGVQGGAGATTLATHLASAWSRWGPRPVLLADLSGGLAFRLDLPPGVCTWASLGPTATELDGLSLFQTLAEPWPGLSVLPLAGLPDGAAEPAPDPWVVDAVLDAGRLAYRLLVVDLPVRNGPDVEAVLAQADVLLAVGRSETAGVRALQSVLDAWEAAGHDRQAGGAVVTGVRARAALAAREVRSALEDRLWALIPAATAELSAAAEDGMVLLDRPDVPAIQAMVTLANRVAPFPQEVVG
ncbi:MAG TPA: cellulose synthase operon protein YhjQ/BcsQ [Actinomycetes bacterium]|nr:cellulose synthase operon protein YhjQ/BcsQ [Actinomycetes bacterium]